MLDFNDLLTKAHINPAEVLVMRHRPREQELRRVFAWIAGDRSDLFRAYQAFQFSRAEKALSRARFLASFIGLISARALFVTFYDVKSAHTVTPDEFWAIPENVELSRLGMTGWPKEDATRNALWFDLRPVETFQRLSGRLEIEWTGGERSWFRWAGKNNFRLSAIHETSVLDRNMPDWDRLVLHWRELAALPPAWRARLAEWRGIYFIVDHSDGKGYVGSAYGADNILGRWLEYGRTGHGGNAQLRRRDPDNFRFSILQRVSPDTNAEAVIALENSWKERLQTRALGLNTN